MSHAPSRTVLSFFAVFGFGLAALPWLPSSAQAADINVSGGSGGGGGGGNGASQFTFGGNSANGGGGGGDGGYNASGSGNAGGGGGASLINGTMDIARNGGDASGATPGAAGTAVGSGSLGLAGNANSGNMGGAGGAGGVAMLSTSGTSADNIYVYGGRGGRGGQGGTTASYDGGDGGDGGSATLILNGNMAVSGNVYVQSGRGGDGARTSAGSGTSGAGGTGGDASLSLSGALTANAVSVFSGGKGESDGYGSLNPGAGGNVGFFAGNLAAQSIDLAKNAGSNLAFNVGTLDVTSSSTSLWLHNTATGTSGTAMGNDGVYIGTARLGNDQLQINKMFDAPGNAAIGTLKLEGRGVFSDGNNYATVGSLTVDGGTLHNGNWNGLIDHAYTTSAITLGTSGATVELGAGEDKALARDLTGTGALAKTGAGTLTLTGANTYSGGTTVSAGTLAGNTSSLQGAITNNAAVNFNQASTGTYAGTMSGTGSLTKTGTGDLTLSGTNTYTGMTEVRAGTLALSGSLASNLLTLHGGASFDASSGTHSLNNGELHVHGQSTYTGNLSAQNALLNFYVPTSMTNGGTLLNVSGTADITGGTVNVGIDGGSSPLQKDDTLTLINAATLTGTPANDGQTVKGTGMQGVTLLYEFDIAAIGNQLRATVSSAPTANTQAKALSEGFLSGSILVNQSADLIAGAGIVEAVRAARRAGGQAPGGAFGTLSGGSLRHDTGSHVDVESLSLLAGLAWGQDLTPGRLTLGAFLEIGNGSYDTYNAFSNAASVHGDGDIRHFGGGVLGRLDFSANQTGHFYTEASARLGKVENEYDSADLRDASGRKTTYDASAPYYGLHLGGGTLLNLNEKTALDLHAKYFWTRQDGDTVRLSTGDPVKFKAVDSHRLRLGGRFTYAINERLTPYVGAAWEHEFDGKAKATTNGFAIDAPSLRGDTAIAELGLSLKPSASSPVSLDLGVQGYAGKREGVTGTLRLGVAF